MRQRKESRYEDRLKLEVWVKVCWGGKVKILLALLRITLTKDRLIGKKKNKVYLHVHRGPIIKLRPKEMTTAYGFDTFQTKRE